MISYVADPEAAFRDSIALEGARTEREFSGVCAEIEARHKAEGITEMGAEAYALVKRQHAIRIAGLILA